MEDLKRPGDSKVPASVLCTDSTIAELKLKWFMRNRYNLFMVDRKRVRRNQGGSFYL